MFSLLIFAICANAQSQRPLPMHSSQKWKLRFEGSMFYADAGVNALMEQTEIGPISLSIKEHSIQMFDCT